MTILILIQIFTLVVSTTLFYKIKAMSDAAALLKLPLILEQHVMFATYPYGQSI